MILLTIIVFPILLQGLVTFKDFSNMLYAAKSLPIGTMTFTLKEEEVYVRVTEGFKQIQVTHSAD
jgi:hypothetical protein